MVVKSSLVKFVVKFTTAFVAVVAVFIGSLITLEAFVFSRIADMPNGSYFCTNDDELRSLNLFCELRHYSGEYQNYKGEFIPTNSGETDKTHIRKIIAKYVTIGQTKDRAVSTLEHHGFRVTPARLSQDGIFVIGFDMPGLHSREIVYNEIISTVKRPYPFDFLSPRHLMLHIFIFNEKVVGVDFRYYTTYEGP